jgi:hypothetical protein
VHVICGCLPSAGDQWLVICRHQTWSDHESEWETIQISRNFKLFAVACCRQVANDYCLTATKGGATTNHSGNVFRPLENTDYLRLLAVGWWLMTNDLPLPKVEGMTTYHNGKLFRSLAISNYLRLLAVGKWPITANHNGKVFRSLENTDYLRLLAVGWWPMTSDLPLPKVEWPRIIMGNYSELWKLQIICGCLLSASCQWLVSCRYQRWSRHES